MTSDAIMFDSQTLDIFWRLFLAVLLGSAIGFEREIAHKFAGMRTHALVALGSALFSIVSSSFSAPNVDPTRIAAQVVTGIGFLGAGLIIFHDSRVHGLTTAAGIWVAAAIGMAVGFDLKVIGIFTTILAILVFVILWPVEQRLIKNLAKDYRESDSS